MARTIRNAHVQFFFRIRNAHVQFFFGSVRETVESCKFCRACKLSTARIRRERRNPVRSPEFLAKISGKSWGATPYYSASTTLVCTWPISAKFGKFIRFSGFWSRTTHVHFLGVSVRETVESCKFCRACKLSTARIRKFVVCARAR